MKMNPFHKLLAGLSHAEYQLVTLEFLKTVSEIVNEPGTIVQTFGEAFQVLDFLATANVVELVPAEGKLGVYKIRKLINGNEI